MATVLVADDDAATRLLVRTVLNYAGHDVLEAADACGALLRARECTPDLILLDLSLRGESGTHVARELRATESTRTIPVVLYTATPMSPAVADFMQIYGIRGAIPKPSEPHELIAAVQAALDGA